MPEKILVVDDEPDLESLIRQRFRKKIHLKEYDFVFARNGLEALAKLLEHNDIGLILSDINMPEMDGLTLLAKLNELKNPALRTVIVSAYGDLDNIRTAMNRGAYDFVMKPVDFTDLETTIEKTIKELKNIRKSLREHEQLVAIRQDLEVARNIQLAILPQLNPPFSNSKKFEIFASMDAAKEVGGDFYDFFMIDENRIGFVIGDVSGKGIPAAIFMAVSRTLIRATALNGHPPGECLAYVNNLLCLESVASMFVTVFYGILDCKTGVLTYANGGHNPPYIIKKDNSVSSLELTGGIALGVLDDISYVQKNITLLQEETLFLYTDGITEAMNETFDLYSDDRLIEFLKTQNNIPLESLIKNTVQSVYEYSSGVEQTDDITALAIRLKPVN